MFRVFVTIFYVFAGFQLLPNGNVTLTTLQGMGQRGGVSQRQAKAAESTGPMLLPPVCLLWGPPLPRGKFRSFGKSD